MVLLVLSNAFSGFINVFVEGIGKRYTYQTANNEFSFMLTPSKGGDVEMMEREFILFKKLKPGNEHLVLYRTFERDPLKFWNWYSYLADNRYDYPYLEHK